MKNVTKNKCIRDFLIISGFILLNTAWGDKLYCEPYTITIDYKLDSALYLDDVSLLNKGSPVQSSGNTSTVITFSKVYEGMMNTYCISNIVNQNNTTNTTNWEIDSYQIVPFKSYRMNYSLKIGNKSFACYPSKNESGKAEMLSGELFSSKQEIDKFAKKTYEKHYGTTYIIEVSE